jgi:hypothetical protein
MPIALIIVAAVVLVVLLVVLAGAPFGDSGVSRAKENAVWSGGGVNPRLRYDPEHRFEPPPDGRQARR